MITVFRALPRLPFGKLRDRRGQAFATRFLLRSLRQACTEPGRSAQGTKQKSSNMHSILSAALISPNKNSEIHELNNIALKVHKNH